jgi:hypothetical protein
VARENPLWGAERIRGELLKLNIKVAKRTIQKYMQAVRSKPPSGQSWSTFLQTHGKDIWACDFVPVVTLFFKTLHAFVIVHHDSRRVVHVGVTDLCWLPLSSVRFLANTCLYRGPTVIVVQPVQYRERHHPSRLCLHRR